ncbi:Dual specificity phosphatase DUPD1 [Bagarius yarrelli]|uniref:Dual specificity phosphatase 29 n=1 Tax=Bagarius yarrelli TaxID=175774 RepID=A0A556VXJ5_BAGYA|nr:Dual specificity phosphatase DUPD1 [Bagarius yarrelli]
MKEDVLGNNKEYVTPSNYELEKLLARGTVAYTHVNEVWPNIFIGDDLTTRSTLPPLSDKLLVHCVMGRSRSATLVLAYLMIQEKMTLVDAIEQVKRRRQIIPNWGFLKQLRELDTFLLEKGSEHTHTAHTTEQTNKKH